MQNKTIGIIGAGIAGLACARRLHDAGRQVRVFDKGRSPGGRIATRRVETEAGWAQFDHGAQFFTARDPAFAESLRALPADAVLPWRAAGDHRLVAAPGMSAFPKALGASLDIAASIRVDAVTRAGAQWSLTGDHGASLGVFDAVVVATPAEQAVPLLAHVAPALAQDSAQATTAPCWSGLFAFAEPVAADVMFEFDDHPVLAWVACDSSKPGRPTRHQTWVAHARADWSRQHLERDAGEVAPVLQNALLDVLRATPTPVVAQAHRWRYAKVERAAGSAFAWDGDLALGACGDWRLGPRVELAWRSGHDLAGAILA
jgi:predicted NAD/FAD-dependent oxidoreductase